MPSLIFSLFFLVSFFAPVQQTGQRVNLGESFETQTGITISLEQSLFADQVCLVVESQPKCFTNPVNNDVYLQIGQISSYLGYDEVYPVVLVRNNVYTRPELNLETNELNIRNVIQTLETALEYLEEAFWYSTRVADIRDMNCIIILDGGVSYACSPKSIESEFSPPN